MKQNKTSNYHKDLTKLMDKFVHLVYDISSGFPKDELFGVTSQLRRAALSIILNYLEGYARNRKTYLKSFIEISYGSLKECKYLYYFAYKRNYLIHKQYNELDSIADTIGKMLWGILSKL